jgi:hypothetical protein
MNENGELPGWLVAIRFTLGLSVAITIELLWLAGIVYAKLGWVEPLSVLEWGLGLAVTLYLVRGLHMFADIISGGGSDSKSN